MMELLYHDGAVLSLCRRNQNYESRISIDLRVLQNYFFDKLKKKYDGLAS
jgi:hypothetical protein